MKILYFDCYSGVSGDMILGAMVDAGVDTALIVNELKKLDLEGYKIKVSKAKRSGITGTKVDVIINEKKNTHHATYKDIKELIEKSRLAEKVKEISLWIFKRIAEAEAKIHNTSIRNVHFHEIGAVDSIVDIVGAAVCINNLAPAVILSSPINTGSGMAKTAHGLLPVPAPATAEMLKGFPFYSSGKEFELATPTGVGIITALSEGTYSIPVTKISKTGYGAGSADFPDLPNLLRIIIGESPASDIPSDSEGIGGFEHDSVTVIESNIDDMNPQFYEHAMNRLFEAGALDVFLAPIIMKKNRPAVKISILADKENTDRLADILLKETTSFGLRMHSVERIKLEKEIKTIKTEYGNVKVKIGKRGGRIINISPEYEDCKRIAKERGLPIMEVYEKAKSAFPKFD